MLEPLHDLSIVSVTGLNAPGLPIGNSGEVAVGDAVYAIGNPEGLEGTFSQGIVSGLRRTGNGTMLQITAPISPGSSGGPILDSTGRIVDPEVNTVDPKVLNGKGLFVYEIFIGIKVEVRVCAS